MAERFDAAVVGAGAAGGLAAYALSRAKRSVLLVCPPTSSGASQVLGGVAWRSPLGARFPSAVKDGLPLDRRVIERRLAVLAPESSLSIDYRDLSWAAQGSGGWVLERSRWDAWARDSAPKLGITVWKDAKLDTLTLDRAGRMTGLQAGGKSVEAGVTLLGDTSVLPVAAARGLRLGQDPGSPARGKGGETLLASVHDLPASRVDDRFGAGPGRGFTWEVVLGFLPKGAMGYGFIFPGHASVHAGVLVEDRSIARAGTTVQEVARLFEAHPSVAPFLRGCARGASALLPSASRTTRGLKLHGDGYLIFGELAAAGATPGIVLRGMDAQAETAWAAAETAREALETKDVSARVLSRYVTRLNSSGALAQLARPDDRARRLKWNPRLHRAYPDLFAALFRRMMTEKGQPKEHMTNLLKDVLGASRIPYTALARDALAAVGSL